MAGPAGWGTVTIVGAAADDECVFPDVAASHGVAVDTASGDTWAAAFRRASDA